MYANIHMYSNKYHIYNTQTYEIQIQALIYTCTHINICIYNMNKHSYIHKYASVQTKEFSYLHSHKYTHKSTHTLSYPFTNLNIHYALQHTIPRNTHINTNMHTHNHEHKTCTLTEIYTCTHREIYTCIHNRNIHMYT